MSKVTKIQNALAGASQFMTNAVAALKTREGLKDEIIERVLNERRDQTYEAVVLSSTEQTEGITVEGDPETPTFFAAARLRIKKLDDEIFPDPAEFVSNDDLESAAKAVAIHQVFYSEEKTTGKDLRPGAIVSVRLINGVFRWTETGGNDPRYNFSIVQGVAGGLQSLFNGAQGLIGQSGEVSWRTKAGVRVNQAAVNFLNRFVEELNAFDPPPTTDVVVTSARRTPLQQANAVLKNVEKNSAWWPYRSSTWNPVRDIAKGDDNRADKLNKMTDFIKKKMDAGRYMSDHLKAGALDIRTKNIIGADIANRLSQFKQAAQATGLAKSIAIEFYEEDATAKTARDRGGTPADRAYASDGFKQ